MANSQSNSIIPAAKAQPLLTIRDLAARANIGTRTASRWLDAGKLPHPIRLGRLIRFDARDVEAWLDAQKGGAK